MEFLILGPIGLGLWLRLRASDESVTTALLINIYVFAAAGLFICLAGKAPAQSTAWNLVLSVIALPFVFTAALHLKNSRDPANYYTAIICLVLICSPIGLLLIITEYAQSDPGPFHPYSTWIIFLMIGVINGYLGPFMSGISLSLFFLTLASGDHQPGAWWSGFLGLLDFPQRGISLMLLFLSAASGVAPYWRDVSDLPS